MQHGQEKSDSGVWPLDVECLLPRVLVQRNGLASRLFLGKGPYKLLQFGQESNLNDAGVTIVKVGNEIESLPNMFVAVALVCAAKCKIAAVLPQKMVHHCVSSSLKRETTGEISHVTSFEKGVLLHLLDAALSDWIQWTGQKVEIRGILNNKRQLKLFFHEEKDDFWSAHCMLRTSAVDEPFFVIGNGSFDTSASVITSSQVNFKAFEQVSVSFRVIVAHTALLLTEVQQIAIGDVVVLDWSALPNAEGQKNEIWLKNGYHSFRAVWVDEFSIEIAGLVKNAENTIKMGEKEMTHLDYENTVSLSSPAITNVKDLEISLQVEVGRIEMTVEQASRLIPGQIVPLNQPVPKDVTLRAGDKLICKGRLVVVEDELALEVTEVP